MWQAAVPIGLAGLNMIFDAVGKADAEDDFEKEKKRAGQAAQSDYYAGFARSMGFPTMGYDQQRKMSEIKNAKMPEQGTDYSSMLSALANAGTSIADEYGSQEPNIQDMDDDEAFRYAWGVR